MPVSSCWSHTPTSIPPTPAIQSLHLFGDSMNWPQAPQRSLKAQAGVTQGALTYRAQSCRVWTGWADLGAGSEVREQSQTAECRMMTWVVYPGTPDRWSSKRQGWTQSSDSRAKFSQETETKTGDKYTSNNIAWSKAEDSGLSWNGCPRMWAEDVGEGPR